MTDTGRRTAQQQQKLESGVMMRHRSRLLQAVRAMREAQFLQASLAEFTVGTVEVNSGVNSMQDTVSTIQTQQRALNQRMLNLETLVMGMSQTMAEVKNLLKDKNV